MKNSVRLIVAFFILITILTGCEHPGSNGSAVYGIWKLTNYDEFEELSQKAGGYIDGFQCFDSGDFNDSGILGSSIPTELTLYKDGTLFAICNNDSEDQINGAYRIDGSQLRMSGYHARGIVHYVKTMEYFEITFTGDKLSIMGSAGNFRFIYSRYDGNDDQEGKAGQTIDMGIPRLDLGGYEKEVAGTYEGMGVTFIFAEDGTMRISSGWFDSGDFILGSYSADKDQIEMMYGASDLSGSMYQTVRYSYSVNKDNLVLYEEGASNGDVYIKTADSQKTARLQYTNAKALSGVFKGSYGYLYIFAEDGNYQYGNESWGSSSRGLYTIIGNSLTLNNDDGSSVTYTFEIDNDLTLFDGLRGYIFSNVTKEYKQRQQDYDAAMASFEAKEFEEAARKFRGISYLDSAEMALESDYQNGLMLFNAGEYASAASVFSALGSYKDSKTWAKSSQREIDLETCKNITIILISKSSEAYLDGVRPYSKPAMEFIFGFSITNSSREDISAISFMLNLRDSNGTLLRSMSFDGSVRVPARNTVSFQATSTIKGYSSITMNDIVAHLMDAEDYTVDIELKTLTLNGRTTDQLNYTQQIQVAAASVISKNIIGSFLESINGTDVTRTITFRDDGILDCVVNSYGTISRYMGTYSTYGNSLSIRFDEYEYDYDIYDLSMASEFRLVNNYLFICTQIDSDMRGIVFIRAGGANDDPGKGTEPGSAGGHNGQYQADSYGTATILVDGLRIRQTPSTSGEITALSIKGDVYRVYEIHNSDGYTWYKIGPGQWIADKDSAYASFIPYVTTGAEESDPIGSLEILVNALRIRQSPSTSGQEKAKVDKGDIYRVYATSYGEGFTWYRIGRDAWVADKNGDYVRFKEIAPESKQIVFVDVYENNGNYTALLSVEEWNGTGWSAILSGIPVNIGSNGTTDSKREGDHCTPSGTFKILFCFSDQSLDTNLRQKLIKEGDVWVTDQNSRYYNTIQSGNASFKDWSKSENIYRQFTSGKSVAGIFFDYNGDGEHADSATPGAGAALFLDGIGSDGNLNSGYGDIKLSRDDMLQLLKILDQSLNPTIIIKSVN